MAVQEPYSNPIAPPDHDQATRGGGKLSNDDFRRLMMTPRAAPTPSQTVTKKQVPSGDKKHHEKQRRSSSSNWQALVRKEDEERQAEWAKIYRDRAKERRDGQNPDYNAALGAPVTTSGYKNVAPNVDISLVAKQRKLDIAESKFLGGDMAHTHMVKGLDYALLQKVRSEITLKDREEEELRLLERRRREKEKASGAAAAAAAAAASKEHGSSKGAVTFRTRMAKNIYRAVFENKPPTRNEFFLPGRMAYVFELNDEFAESDIPTTLLRSKADCPSVEVQTTLSTNDIVINKLTQILSYLRQGTHASKKNKRKDKGKPSFEPEKRPLVSESIFADTGDYKVGTSASSARPMKATSYFGDQPSEVEEQSAADIHKSASEFVKAVSTKYSAPPSSVEEKIAAGWSEAELGVAPQPQSGKSQENPPPQKVKSQNVGFGGFEVAGHYAECYPGGMEEMDATVNSDDEADYTKMDMGSHKGPVKRWDFDNEDDYSTYQSSREAMPKAAFQYGVKMNDGRKTRRQTGANKEKAKLDREWQQISQILHKRKSEKLDVVTKRLKTD